MEDAFRMWLSKGEELITPHIAFSCSASHDLLGQCHAAVIWQWMPNLLCFPPSSVHTEPITERACCMTLLFALFDRSLEESLAIA